MKTEENFRLAPSILDLADELRQSLQSIPNNCVVTPFMALNAFTEGGLRGFAVLGGPPKSGKSTFAMNCALVAAEFEIPVLYVDMEHSWPFLTLKMLAAQTRKTIEGVKAVLQGNGGLALPRYLQALTFWQGSILPQDIIFNIRTLARPDQQALVVVDSLQKLPVMRGADHHSSINLWLREFEAIKNQFAVTFLVISELSRGEGGKNYQQAPPTSLKGSGDIEYTAEQSYFLAPAGGDGLYKLTLEYNRFGVSGEIEALYSQRDFKYWRWVEIAR